MHALTKCFAITGMLVAACPAEADSVSYDLGLAPLDITQPGFYPGGNVARFDTALGTLTDVTLSVTGTIAGSANAAFPPLLDVEFSDEADHIFGVYGAVFTTSGPVTPQGVTFSITTEGGYAAQNVALFTDLFPGTTLSDNVFANGFTGNVTFSADTLTYAYTPVPEPRTITLLFAPAFMLCGWCVFRRGPSRGRVTTPN